jgi:hypothetical protein
MVMFTIRNMGGVALFLAASTWLWLTPMFATKGVTTSGFLWSATRTLSLVTIVVFCVATVGLFARQPWWETAAISSALIGFSALIPYWFAGTRGGESAGTASWNVMVHMLMVAGILTLLLVPQLERWVQHHVISR